VAGHESTLRRAATPALAGARLAMAGSSRRRMRKRLSASRVQHPVVNGSVVILVGPRRRVEAGSDLLGASEHHECEVRLENRCGERCISESRAQLGEYAVPSLPLPSMLINDYAAALGGVQQPLDLRVPNPLLPVSRFRLEAGVWIDERQNVREPVQRPTRPIARTDARTDVSIRRWPDYEPRSGAPGQANPGHAPRRATARPAVAEEMPGSPAGS
jgi:hypothetical protein